MHSLETTPPGVEFVTLYVCQGPTLRFGDIVQFINAYPFFFLQFLAENGGM